MGMGKSPVWDVLYRTPRKLKIRYGGLIIRINTHNALFKGY